MKTTVVRYQAKPERGNASGSGGAGVVAGTAAGALLGVVAVGQLGVSLRRMLGDDTGSPRPDIRS